jgi:hypothetical protein
MRGRKQIPFMDYVSPEPNSGCWLWTGAMNRDGYGHARRDSKTQLAHRVSYQMHRGPIPEGMCVCHTCDEPSCVNPDHLWLGTHLDNVRDMNAKGRHHDASGEANGRAKLTIEKVREIRAKLANGQARKNIVTEYGISRSSVSLIHLGKIWRAA